MRDIKEVLAEANFIHAEKVKCDEYVMRDQARQIANLQFDVWSAKKEIDVAVIENKKMGFRNDVLMMIGMGLFLIACALLGKVISMIEWM